MFKIIKDGKTIAITEQLIYIRQKETGVFVACEEQAAQGVAVNNTAYNIFGREEMKGCETVAIMEVDGGGCIFTGDEDQTETDTMIVEHEYRLTILEMGVK